MQQDNFVLMLEMQLALQRDSMKDGDPGQLEGDDMATFVTWNFAACVKELSEATDEVGWKPWATSRHINQPAFNKEMVDAFHFFMNLLLVANPGRTPTEIVTLFTMEYIRKNEVNRQRQEEGYDGVTGKCGYCHRDLGEVVRILRVKGPVHEYCNQEHHDLHRAQVDDVMEAIDRG